MPTQAQTPFRIAIAGLGTVGAGAIELMTQNKDMLAARCGRPIDLVAVSARDRAKDRGLDISGYDWVDNPVALAERNDVDAVVELIGGSDGPALALAKAALSRGRCVVTANKALIAHHGATLAQLAESHGAGLRFEAAVAGGIPIVKALNEGLAGTRTRQILGILNGTCNFVLTEMEKTGASFEDTVRRAQDLGYAEADPSFDLDGIDTAHKIAILGAMAFGLPPSADGFFIEGIRAISAVDIDYARELGYRIKLLGVARMADGRVDLRVHPCMVPAASALAQVDGATNAVMVDSAGLGQTVYEGQGAGAGPTASAVLADVVDLARGACAPAFGMRADQLRGLPRLDVSEHEGCFYIRLRVEDKPGVIAEVSAILRDHDVSVQSLIQRGKAAEGGVYLVLTTHLSSERAVSDAVAAIARSSHVLVAPTMLRIEED
ncbi:MAG: homoserine dehydrogenase [Rhodothalassiaceae bacterium]